MTALFVTLFAAFFPFILSGCQEPPAAEPVTPRVKVYTVGKAATGQERRLSGKVEATEKSALSFGVGGRIVEIIVSEGQEVTEGQLLARLEEDSPRIAVDDARARVKSARARQVETRRQYNRSQSLYKQRAISRQELDAATANLATADAELEAATGALAQAEINLGRTNLVAPFASKVAEIPVDPFQEVAPGETVMTLQSGATLEVSVRVPETLIRYVDYGQAVRIDFPTLPDVTVPGVVASVGAEALEGNAFPVKVRISDTETDIRPGMTASVTFNFDAYLEGKTVYLIPLSAIALDAAFLEGKTGGERDGGTEAPVFVFDPSAGQVRKRTLLIGDLRGNEVEVYEGLAPGDQVVTAGVSFLRDGMKADAWRPERGA